MEKNGVIQNVESLQGLLKIADITYLTKSFCNHQLDLLK